MPIIREASINDAVGVARVHVDSWRSTYRGIVSDGFLDGLTYEKAVQHFISIFRNQDTPVFGFVAEVDDQIVGFAAGGYEKTGDAPYQGELYAIYILKEYQRQGIGRRLVQAVGAKLKEMGLGSMLAWVLVDNLSRQFYEALGGQKIRNKMLDIGGRDYEEIAYELVYERQKEIGVILTNDKVRETFEAIAGEYDQKRKILIPCYEEFYTIPISLIPKFAGEIRALDIGAGTGLFTQFLLQQYPMARVTLIDIAEGMLDVAKSRFKGNNNVNYMTRDFTLCSFKEEFNVIISGLSIHHLDDEGKQELFKKIYEWLQPGGMFINSEQVLGNTERLEYAYKRKWQEQIKLAGVSEQDIEAWKERLKIDQETTVEQQIKWLQGTGFVDVDCIYKYYKFAVLVGFKPG